ncbi:MAG: RT0821/Lpp0805 family surface protein [Gammaproteobacteria bacterium]
MFYLRTIIFAAGVALATALLLQDAAVADPPDWAPAHGYRNKYHKHADKQHKHKHDRYKRDHDEDDSDARYGYYRDRDWHRDAYRDNEPYPHPASRRDELKTVDQPIFVDGECTPRNVTVTGAEAGAALGSALGTTIGSGNPLATVAGSIAGAMLGNKADAARTTGTDEDCFRQVLERATDRQQVAWDNDSSSTHYELTPVRSYRRSGQTCRELVTTIERHGAVREVYQTACRHSDGRWHLMD